MKQVYVVEPFLPPLEEFTVLVQRAYDNNWLTNLGELVLELETKVHDCTGCKSNMALMLINN